MSPPASAPAIDPRGQCATCRFFIDDPKEIGEELRLLANDGRTVIKTVERTGGEGLRAMTALISIDRALQERTGLRLTDVGLCEKGVARFVARNAGGAVDRETGRRVDQCAKWAESGRIVTPRPPSWRAARERALRAALPEGAPTRELGPFDKCPCQSGRVWAACCGRK